MNMFLKYTLQASTEPTLERLQLPTTMAHLHFFILINNALSRKDKPYNIGITTFSFMIVVRVLF